MVPNAFITGKMWKKKLLEFLLIVEIAYSSHSGPTFELIRPYKKINIVFY
jgi:hypothetical protein